MTPKSRWARARAEGAEKGQGQAPVLSASERFTAYEVEAFEVRRPRGELAVHPAAPPAGPAQAPRRRRATPPSRWWARGRPSAATTPAWSGRRSRAGSPPRRGRRFARPRSSRSTAPPRRYDHRHRAGGRASAASPTCSCAPPRTPRRRSSSCSAVPARWPTTSRSCWPRGRGSRCSSPRNGPTTPCTWAPTTSRSAATPPCAPRRSRWAATWCGSARPSPTARRAATPSSRHWASPTLVSTWSSGCSSTTASRTAARG